MADDVAVDTAEAERLAAAEGWWVYWEYSGSLTDVGTAEQRAAARVLHAEYDRRGAALDAARAEAGRGSDAELARNRRLAARIAAGSDECPLDDVIEFAQRLGRAHLDVPGPRAAQLADELVAARAEVERLRVQLNASQPVITAAVAYSGSTAEPTDTPHEDALLDAVEAYQRATQGATE